MSSMQLDDAAYARLQRQLGDVASAYYASLTRDVVQPPPGVMSRSRSALRRPDGDAAGIGVDAAVRHVAEDILPVIGRMAGPRFFGFVTGGATPAAQAGDHQAAVADSHVQVHMPTLSIATTVDDLVLRELLAMLRLEEAQWRGRSLTTGATASNVLGLACARNHTLGQDVGECGFDGRRVKVYCAAAHASTRKAASIVGIGRANCIEVVDRSDPYGVSFDLRELERLLREDSAEGKVVVASFGEVNTGLFTAKLPAVRRLCDRYDAWLHIDAAFAVFAGLYPRLGRLLDGLTLADSITCDAHKWLNVPYDCGLFFTKHIDVLKDVCSGGDSPYLTSAISSAAASNGNGNGNSGGDDIPIQSPMHVGIENSRRFRSLPLYTQLVAYGRSGLVDIITRSLEFARRIDAWLRTDAVAVRFYRVLTPDSVGRSIGDALDAGEHELTNIVLFTTPSSDSAKAFDVDAVAEHVNDSGKCYVTATTFMGERAIRIAISNWRTGLPHADGVDDFDATTDALTAAALHFGPGEVS